MGGYSYSRDSGIAMRKETTIMTPTIVKTELVATMMEIGLAVV